jgi:hypothetical protein
MAQHYSDPRRESMPHALPNVETFHVSPHASVSCPLCAEAAVSVKVHKTAHVGWYWQSCFPGCLPDSDPCGPFDTEAEALADARESIEDDGEEA